MNEDDNILPFNSDPVVGQEDKGDPVELLTSVVNQSDLEDVLVIGWGEDGGLFSVTSNPDMERVLAALEMVKFKLLQGGV